MNALRRAAAMFLRPLGLSALLLGAVVAAQPVSRLRNEPPARPLKPAGQDASLGFDANAGGLSAEDREVVENLELLENLEQSDNLDLLVELSKED